MKAKDLIRVLSAMPADAEIIVEGYETGFDSVHEIQEIKVVEVKNPSEFDGQYQLESELNDQSWHLTAEQKQDIAETIQRGKRFYAVLIRGKRGHLR